MLARIFPKQFDNNYRGLWLAVWLFVPLMLVKALQGANSMIFPRQVLVGADGIPIDQYGPAAGDAAFPHASRNYCRVRCHSASCG